VVLLSTIAALCYGYLSLSPLAIIGVSVTGFFVGVFTILEAIRYSVSHAEMHLSHINEHVQVALDPYQVGETQEAGVDFSTGISALDSLFENTRNSVVHLLSTLAQLGEEVNDFVERYELLTNNLSASVVIRNADEEVIFCSPYSEVLTGYSIEEIYDSGGAILDRIVSEEDRQRYERAKQINALGEDIAVRYQIKHKSGITLWIESHLVPVCDEHGEVVSVMSVSIDVTASVRYQQRIEEQNRDLNDFTYMVSHDLKAPIFTIKGMAALLLEDYADKLDEEALESFQYIIDGANRLEMLVKSVVEFSAVSTNDFEEQSVDILEQINNALSDYHQQILDTDAKIEIPPSLPPVMGEELRLYQVFSNLIGNAIKYRDPTRALEIKISAQASEADLLVIEVQDNGLGIPADKLEDVFRPYHRAHGNDIEGSGIGLACVKKIVDRLGAGIKVESEVGVGSKFYVAFRRADVEAPRTPDDEVSQIPYPVEL
jgi:PAS domain S-box-containing protein